MMSFMIQVLRPKKNTSSTANKTMVNKEVTAKDTRKTKKSAKRATVIQSKTKRKTTNATSKEQLATAAKEKTVAENTSCILGCQKTLIV